ncbi:MAG: hypothetical protein US74_C0013G0015 [Parcubacteria group bacterium GW2011_GWA2_38_13]|nr:MAG: hypothetical protein US74_C0013G0015 [Parcubacteria group bacterium GW2011_GWA2_38_13]
MKKKILICGASGFIGRNLFETLSKRNDLDVWGTYLTEKFSDNPNIIRVDLTQKEEVIRATKDFDIIIQAAAVTSGAKDIIERPYIHITDNLIMNSLIFQAAYDNHIKQVIFFSCTVMYPSSKLPVKEKDLDLNSEMYEKYFGAGWTKVYMEKLCEFYSRLGRTKFTVIRHSNIYGPYDKYDLEKSHVFAATIMKIMNAKDNKIVVWGAGIEERDLLYVSDLMDFVELVLEKQDYSFDLFNVGLGIAISVDSLVKKIISLSGKNLAIEYDKTKPTIATKLVLDISKAKEKFGWKPKISLDEGIKKTLDWYSKNILKSI